MYKTYIMASLSAAAMASKLTQQSASLLQEILAQLKTEQD